MSLFPEPAPAKGLLPCDVLTVQGKDIHEGYCSSVKDCPATRIPVMHTVCPNARQYCCIPL